MPYKGWKENIISMENDNRKSKITKHKNLTIAKITGFMDKLLETDPAKADKLCYWLEQYTDYLETEASFSPKNLKSYKRGEVIKANLGFNIGSEEGGLHYCVVLEKNNPVNSSVVTVVPLTSVKPHTDVNKLNGNKIYLGNSLQSKLKEKQEKIEKNLNETISQLANAASEEIDQIMNKAMFFLNQRDAINKEIDRMKSGSIALVGQITTISKLRIYDPKKNKDVLANIKLPNEYLDKIDTEIKHLFVN